MSDGTRQVPVGDDGPLVHGAGRDEAGADRGGGGTSVQGVPAPAVDGGPGDGQAGRQTAQQVDGGGSLDAGESRATGGEITRWCGPQGPLAQAAPCEYCGGQITPPRRTGGVKRFGQDKCRANWGLDARRKVVDTLLAGLRDTAQNLEAVVGVLETQMGEVMRLQALNKVALDFVQKNLVVGRRKPREGRR